MTRFGILLSDMAATDEINHATWQQIIDWKTHYLSVTLRRQLVRHPVLDFQLLRKRDVII